MGVGDTSDRYVLDLQEIDRTHVAIVGGKGANLGELSRMDGIDVPAGYCVTTDAFRRIIADAPSIHDRLDRLSHLDPTDRDAIRALSAQIRRDVEGVHIPDDLAAAITRPLARLGGGAAYAVRSSATAEDLPGASFAGQQDTYLNVVGPVAVLEHVSRCWASLFTERAVAYRLQHGFDHRAVLMAVVRDSRSTASLRARARPAHGRIQRGSLLPAFRARRWPARACGSRPHSSAPASGRSPW